MTATSLSLRSLPDLVTRFDERAHASPQAPAIRAAGGVTSYAELARASLRVADVLRTRCGVGAGDRVLLRVEPGASAIAAMLGTLRCGAAYVPLDLHNPDQRNQLIIEDCQPAAVIGMSGPAGLPVLTASQLDQIMAGDGTGDDDSGFGGAGPLPAERICYVIYTSGTTGRPKGVPVTHRNVAALFDAACGVFEVGASDVWLLYHSLAFDFSVWEIWGPLLTGGCLLIVDRWARLSLSECVGLMLRGGVTVLSQTPTAFSLLAGGILDRVTSGAGLPLRYIVFGGERLEYASLAPWAERFGLERPALVNMYGLTEATVHATYHRITSADIVTSDITSSGSAIGRPLPGFHARVVDGGGRPAARGELVVAGPQLTAGYLNRPAITASRFGPDPQGSLAGLTFYATGDLVEWRGHDLVYLGRKDRQVKIHGHRIELGEVEAAVAAIADVARVAACTIGTAARPTLACAYTTHSGLAADPARWRDEIASRLPAYMIPARLVWLASMPVTVNGKIDPDAVKAALSADHAPDGSEHPVAGDWASSSRDDQGAATIAERWIAELWAALLGIDRVRRADDFFELGGDSLVAVRVIESLRGRFGVEISPRTFYLSPTPAGLAAAVGIALAGADS